MCEKMEPFAVDLQALSEREKERNITEEKTGQIEQR